MPEQLTAPPPPPPAPPAHARKHSLVAKYIERVARSDAAHAASDASRQFGGGTSLDAATRFANATGVDAAKQFGNQTSSDTYTQFSLRKTDASRQFGNGNGFSSPRSDDVHSNLTLNTSTQYANRTYGLASPRSDSSGYDSILDTTRPLGNGTKDSKYVERIVKSDADQDTNETTQFQRANGSSLGTTLSRHNGANGFSPSRSDSGGKNSIPEASRPLSNGTNVSKYFERVPKCDIKGPTPYQRPQGDSSSVLDTSFQLGNGSSGLASPWSDSGDSSSILDTSRQTNGGSSGLASPLSDNTISRSNGNPDQSDHSDLHHANGYSTLDSTHKRPNGTFTYSILRPLGSPNAPKTDGLRKPDGASSPVGEEAPGSTPGNDASGRDEEEAARSRSANCISPLRHGIGATLPCVYGPIPYKSPHRYVESEVTIHYRSPVRAEAKEALPEEELARRQAEAMRRIYQEERRRKYLQELQDMHSRRHTDNFTPSQKSPIPLNRYDDILDDLSSSKQKSRDRTPEPKLVARALYNFVGQTSRELSFRRGDIIFVRRQIDKNWYEGEHNAMVGLFPLNYVEIIPYDGIRTMPKRPTEGQARAKFNFVAQTHLELSLVKGELVVLTRRVDENWYEGRIGNKKGIFPVTYVEVMSEPGERAVTPSSGSTKPLSASTRSLLMNGGGTKQSYQSYQTQQAPASSYYNRLGSSYTSTNPYATMPRQGQTGRSNMSPMTQTLHIDTHSEPVPYRALYNYRPQNEDELELVEGETVHVMEKCDDGWYVGSSQRTGFFGTFPGNYVERL